VSRKQERRRREVVTFSCRLERDASHRDRLLYRFDDPDEVHWQQFRLKPETKKMSARL